MLQNIIIIPAFNMHDALYIGYSIMRTRNILRIAMFPKKHFVCETNVSKMFLGLRSKKAKCLFRFSLVCSHKKHYEHAAEQCLGNNVSTRQQRSRASRDGPKSRLKCTQLHTNTTFFNLTLRGQFCQSPTVSARSKVPTE